MAALPPLIQYVPLVSEDGLAADHWPVPSSFLAGNDADRLHETLSKVISNDHELVFLVHAPPPELQKIVSKYQERYHDTLVRRLLDKTHFSMHTLMEQLLTDEVSRDVAALEHAFGMLSMDRHLLLEILLCRPNQHKAAVLAAYEKKHGHTLQKKIHDETMGPFRDMLTNLCEPRNEQNVLEDRLAAKETLHKIEELRKDKIAVHSHFWVNLLTKASVVHLNEVIRLHDRTPYLMRQSFADMIQEQIESPYRSTISTAAPLDRPASVDHVVWAASEIVIYAGDGRHAFFADYLHHAMHHHSSYRLVRGLLLCRRPADMQAVEKAFAARHKKTLRDEIVHHGSGAFKEALLAIVEGPPAKDLPAPPAAAAAGQSGPAAAVAPAVAAAAAAAAAPAAAVAAAAPSESAAAAPAAPAPAAAAAPEAAAKQEESTNKAEAAAPPAAAKP